MKKKYNGFTLVELAIVIVIIGLLVGGVLQGQELITQAKLRSMTKQVQSYQAAILLFRDKYKFPPGDQPRAFDFWGTATGCQDAVVQLGDMTGCNGDGSQTIDDPGWPLEIFRAWQFLAAGNYIKGSFSGLNGSLGPYDATKDSSPTAPFENAVFDFRSRSTQNWTNAAIVENSFSIGVIRQTANGSTSSSGSAGPFLVPTDARSFDEKMDDGLPGMGKVRSRPQMTQPNCATSSSGSTATYNPATVRNGCSLFIEIGL